MKKITIALIGLIAPFFLVAQSIQSDGASYVAGYTSGAALSSSGVELYSQFEVSPGGIVSQNCDTPDDAFDSESADDFDVPTGNIWAIDEIVVSPRFEGSIPSPDISLTVKFYDNNVNEPGNLLESLTFSINSTNFSSNGIITLPSIVQVPEGKHWVSVVANYGNSSVDRFFWGMINSGRGENACLINPNGGYGLGSNWVDITTISGNDSLSFALYGTEVSTVPVSIWAIAIGFFVIAGAVALRVRKKIKIA